MLKFYYILQKSQKHTEPVAHGFEKGYGELTKTLKEQIPVNTTF
ncbi:MAG: hypothetical protein ACHP6I_03320 [Rickettsiales bacterium]